MIDKNICAVGTIRGNRVKDCPLLSNKALEKQGRGTLDHRTDLNSGITITKWVDNKTVLVASNYVQVHPMDTIKRWDKASNTRKDITCPQIVKAYNKNMRGVDLADMLLSIYRINYKTKRWYIKIFWHLVYICKVNGWNLYR